MRSHIALLVFCAVACTTAEPEAPEGPVDLRVNLEPPAFGYQIHSQPHVVPPGKEVATCDVVKIEPAAGETLIWLNSFESKTSLYSHHMNVMAGYFSVLDAVIGEGRGEAMLGKKLGQYDCEELGDLMEDQGAQTVYPSQQTHQKGTFPAGVAIPAVAPLVLIMQHHYINTTDKPVLVDARVNLHRVEEAKVKYVATGFFGGSKVELPGKSRKIISKTCAINADVNLFAISSHSHERGKCFTMNFYDGTTKQIEPEPFFVNPDWESPPILFLDQQEWTGKKAYPMSKGDGVHWACHYVNEEDRVVVDGGSADDEMCIFVGVGYPSQISVDEIKALVAKPSLDAVNVIAEKALVGCDEVTDATSPWPHPNEAFALKSAFTPAHSTDEQYDACGDFEPTIPAPVE